MTPDGFTVSALVGTPLDLPPPFNGYYEVWQDSEGETAWFVLNVFFVLKTGRQCFLKSFHGEVPSAAMSEFQDWLMGEYNTQLFG